MPKNDNGDGGENSLKDRLQKDLIFCFQNSLSFKGFWKEFRSSYFVTIPKHLYEFSPLVIMFVPAAVRWPGRFGWGVRAIRSEFCRGS